LCFFVLHFCLFVCSVHLRSGSATLRGVTWTRSHAFSGGAVSADGLENWETSNLRVVNSSAVAAGGAAVLCNVKQLRIQSMNAHNSVVTRGAISSNPPPLTVAACVRTHAAATRWLIVVLADSHSIDGLMARALFLSLRLSGSHSALHLQAMAALSGSHSLTSSR